MNSIRRACSPQGEPPDPKLKARPKRWVQLRDSSQIFCPYRNCHMSYELCDLTCLSPSVSARVRVLCLVMGIFPGVVLSMAQRGVWRVGGREGQVMPPNNRPVWWAAGLETLMLQPRLRSSHLSSFIPTLITHADITGALKEKCLKSVF